MSMFIIIPLVIVGLSLVGIAIIIWRKVPYLRKLTPEVGEHAGSWWHDMIPELIDWYRGIRFRQHRDSFFQETEKFLRKIRLAFSRIDRFSASLIHRVRKVHIESSLQAPAPSDQPSVAPAVSPLAPSAKQEQSAETSAERLKRREQELIIEIAKDPKSPELYESLGDIYVAMHAYADAKESYEAALEFRPNDAKLEKKLSEVLANLPIRA